jgi:hypothetical protein
MRPAAVAPRYGLSVTGISTRLITDPSSADRSYTTTVPGR